MTGSPNNSGLCPRCRGMIDPATAGFTEHGFVCQLCLLDEVDKDEAQLRAHSFEAHEAINQPRLELTPELIAANVVGIGLAAVTGVGFTVGPRRAQSMEEYEHELAKIKAERRGAAALPPSRSIYLRRGEHRSGPHTISQLSEMWEAGHVQPTDEYWYPGMREWLPVTQFAAPPT